MWLEEAITSIRDMRFPAYFVCPDTVSPAEAKHLFAVVRLDDKFRERFDAAWRRLTKDDTFRLHLYAVWDDKDPQGDWYVVNLFLS
jgi:hypothetical protein